MAPPSASSSGSTYEVFLNFRGVDTRNTFTGHLYNGLDGAKIRTFVDSENLHIGEDIGEELLSAIQQSKISIPIFSKNYASSKWCLKELVKIVECRKTMNQLVLPIFYDVDPSDVHHSIGTYAEALQKHGNRFDQKIIEEWKQALGEIGALNGWDLKNIANGHEGTLVKNVVAEVSSKLIKDSQIVSDDLVGIQSHVAEMMSLLNIKSEDEDVKIVGVWGLGGIGKTTIAKVVYNTISHYFEGCSFLENVRESSQNYRGLVDLQNQLVSNLLKGESFKITNVNEGSNVISERFCKMKVLIVLDDVEEKSQLETFIKERDWFGSGSRIIITTRDARILVKVDKIYEPSEMDTYHSLQLFSKCAFRSDHTPDDFLNLSKEIVRITGGLPLALEVIGSSLSEMDNISEWEETLERLQEIPNDEVQKKLKISYDGLTDFQKDIFLDIACFCIGVDKNIACFVWKKRKFFPESGIKVHCQKSLVKIGENNELKMHDQLKDLGKEIVRQENLKVPGERSRLWSHKEALEVLEKNTGTDKVEALCIDFRDGSSKQSYLTSEGFAKMNRLRLLQVDYAQFAPGFEPSFSELIWLRWKGCPSKFMLMKFRPVNLVVLDLSYSLVRIDWTGWNSIKVAKNLKVLNLTGCQHLSKIPQVSRLEVLILENCVKLECIDESIEFLERLVTLNMRGCTKLKNLPYGIGGLTSLKNLNLHQCVKLEKLPDSIATLQNLETVDASFCYMEDGGISDAIGWLSSLKILRLGGNDFHSLPVILSSLSVLQTLDLRFCEELESLPELPSSLKYLNVLRCKSLKSLSGLSNLTNLEVLCLDDCENLKELRLPGFSMLRQIEGLEGLDSLELLTINQCKSLRKMPKLSDLKKLRVLEVEGCKQLHEIEGFVGLDSLNRLIISWCKSLRKMPKLSDLKLLSEVKVEGCEELHEIEGFVGLDSLVQLTIRSCKSLRKMPKLFDLKLLSKVEVECCEELHEIEGFVGLDSLVQLTIRSCKSLRKMPKLSDLKKLMVLEVEGCEQLHEIEGFVGLDSLDRLTIKRCKSLRKMPKLSDLKLLRELEVEGCKQLLEIEGIVGLDSLELLTIRRCNSLEKIPDSSNMRNLKHRTIAGCPRIKEIQGLDKRKSLDRHEVTLVRKAVAEFSSKLIKDSQIVSDDLVGIQSHVAKMMCLLNIKSEDESVEIVGLCGLGGIGKTTIAKVVYNTISHHFEGCSFLENVQETSQHYGRGLIDLQNLLVTNLLKGDSFKITNVDKGINVIKERLCKMKVLIVLDDVEEKSQLETFIKERDWFGSGSRIIITTRDARILVKVDKIYKPSEMDTYHSLQLFSKCAFRSDHTPDDFLNLSKEIVRITGGLPLALEVIGSSLFETGISKWEETLEMLQEIPNDEVQKKLKISYDGLTDFQKDIFLDIACFCNGMDKNIASFVWKKYNFYPESGIRVLCQKSLVKIGENNELKMHDQLKDLGKELVRQENLKVPGECSRLWSHKEALEVLEEHTGTKNVEGLCIDFGGSSSGQSCLTSEGFAKMNRLRLLQVDYAQFAPDFVPSFSELIWLRWKGCPLDFMLKNFHPVNLVVLDLSYSLVSFDWTGWDHIKVARNLKVLSLTGCQHLSKTPKLANHHLEVLILENCVNLVEIDESINFLERLVTLNVRGCTELWDLPYGFWGLTSLKNLNLHQCEALEKLPDSIATLRNLETFDASFCYIKDGGIPAVCPSSLKILRLGGNDFHSLPMEVSSLSFLQTLDLWFCNKLESLPELPSSLKYLNVLRCRSLKSLPWLSNLTNLEVLCLDDCDNLVEMPALLGLRNLVRLNLDNCHSLTEIGSLVGLDSLKLFAMKNCGSLRKIGKMSSLRKLKELRLTDNSMLLEIEGLEGLDSLELLTINRCTSLRKIPKLFDLKKLRILELQSCEQLLEIEDDFVCLDSLDRLIINRCTSLGKIPKLSDLKKLRVLEVGRCEQLLEIEGDFVGLESLDQLTIKRCTSLRKIPKLSDLKKLTVLEVHGWKQLLEIEGDFVGLDSLDQLIINGCTSLRKIPKLSGLKKLMVLEVVGCEQLLEIEGDFVGLDSLDRLTIKRCTSLRKIPKLSDFKKLTVLEVDGCKQLLEIEGNFVGLVSLDRLIINQCTSLRKIPNLSYFKKLRVLEVNGCEQLLEIEGDFVGLKSLDQLIINQCTSLKKIPNLSYLKKLTVLEVNGCEQLLEIESDFVHLDSLERLTINWCTSLRKIPKLSDLKNLRVLEVNGCDQLLKFEDDLVGLDFLDRLTINWCTSYRKI